MSFLDKQKNYPLDSPTNAIVYKMKCSQPLNHIQLPSFALSPDRQKNSLTDWFTNTGIGCPPQKKCSIKVKKKRTEKWRWHSRKLKTRHMCNNIMVFLFIKNKRKKKKKEKKDLFTWYDHLNVYFWQFWHRPNILKTYSEMALRLLLLL